MPILLDCGYEDSPHEFPDDWIFGGADGNDPRADPRWEPTTYIYLDRTLHDVHVTQTPLCLEQAIDEFTLVQGWGNLNPIYLQVTTPDDRRNRKQGTVLDLVYVAATDCVHPIG